MRTLRLTLVIFTLTYFLCRFTIRYTEQLYSIYLGNNMSKATHVNIILDAKTNKTLDESAIRNGRTKRKEAQVRLTDHLNRFDNLWMGVKGIEKKGN